MTLRACKRSSQYYRNSHVPIIFAEIVETTLVTFAIHEALNTGEMIFMKEKYEEILRGVAQDGRNGHSPIA
jgi:hypothetical protein